MMYPTSQMGVEQSSSYITIARITRPWRVDESHQNQNPAPASLSLEICRSAAQGQVRERDKPPTPSSWVLGVLSLPFLGPNFAAAGQWGSGLAFTLTHWLGHLVFRKRGAPVSTCSGTASRPRDWMLIGYIAVAVT